MKEKSLNLVAGRIFNTPLLVHPDKIQAILAGIGPRLNVAVPELEGELAESVNRPKDEMFDPRFEHFDYYKQMYQVGRTALIPVAGALVHRGRHLGSYSGVTSYSGISEQLEICRDLYRDNTIDRIVLNMHTYGGEVAGCFDLVDHMAEVREEIPMYALVSDAACSAGYAIASACNEVILTQTAITGSIGVVMTHYDWSQYADKEGLKVTHIHAGKEKVLGSQFKPLSDEDKAKLSSDVEFLMSVFVDKVSENRGIDGGAIRAMEAATYSNPNDAIERGLADRISSGRELMREFAEEDENTGARSRVLSTTKEKSMKTQQQGAASEPTADSVSLEEHNNAVTAAKREGAKEATATAVADERARIGSIIRSEHAEGRTDMAHHLAFETDMSADAAVALLQKAPCASATLEETEASAEAPADPLGAAMASAGTPGVGAGSAVDDDDDDARAQQILNVGVK